MGWTSYPPQSVFRWTRSGIDGRTDPVAGRPCIRGDLFDVGRGELHHDDFDAAAPGMKMFRMPMTVWAMFVTAILQAFALPVLTGALVMQLLDRTIGTNFFSPSGRRLQINRGRWAVVRRSCFNTCSGFTATRRCT